VVAQPGGVLMRAGHTEAGCDLTQLAGLTPAAVICEIMNDDGTMARLPDLIPFAQTHGLKVGTIADLIHYRAATESIIERCGSRRVQLPAGEFELVVYRDKPSGAPHLALVKGVIDPERESLVRVHEPVSVLDFLDATASTHSWPIPKALAAIAQAEAGVLVLLNCAEPSDRLFAKFDALVSEASGDEVARQARMDLRTYGIGAQILRDLNVGQMKLLARPRKMPSMADFGLHTTGFVES
jgi:3,4-dihydroxy 2-butanone 4-phosphate synthase/GTP cyclohydrolase II